MKPTGNSAHARCQKGGVPQETEIYFQLIHLKRCDTTANFSKEGKKN